MSSQPADTLGLEFLIGAQRFVLAAESVAQIVEYEVSPLPHAGRWVAGLGILGTKVLVSIALAAPRALGLRAGPNAAGARRSTKGVLLNVPSSSVAWALEVSEVSSFVRTELDAVAAPPSDVPAWIRRARTSDGRRIGWVDAQELVRALSLDGGRALASAGGPG